MEFVREVNHEVIGCGHRAPSGVGAVFDGGNRVVFGLTESYIERVATGQKLRVSQCEALSVLTLLSVELPTVAKGSQCVVPVAAFAFSPMKNRLQQFGEGCDGRHVQVLRGTAPS